MLAVLWLQIKTANIISITADTSIAAAKKIMVHHHIRHLPIVQDGKICGMISSRDILAQQLKVINRIVRHQWQLLAQLEDEHQGISNIRTDSCGSVVI